MTPVRGVWIQQYGNGDWQKIRCEGQPVCIWRYDADGLAQTGTMPELDRHPIASSTPVISFCVDETAGRMIYQEWNGRRSARGSIFTRTESGEWIAEVDGWRS